MNVDLENYEKWNKASQEFHKKLQMKLNDEYVDTDILDNDIVHMKKLLEVFMGDDENKE